MEPKPDPQTQNILPTTPYPAKKNLKPLFIIIGFFIVITAMFIMWQFLNGTRAARALQPIVSNIEKQGGHKICDSKHDGGIFFNTPQSYETYYRIHDTPNLSSNLKNAAKLENFHLKNDTDLIKVKKSHENDKYYPYPLNKYNPLSEYLIGHNGDKTLNLIIHRQTSVELFCDENFDWIKGYKNYGRKIKTGDSDAIIFIGLSVPNNHFKD